MDSAYITRPYRYPQMTPVHLGTQVVVHPLGINASEWNQLASSYDRNWLPGNLAHLRGQQIVLSVDRADYTKAVHERLRIIDRFFAENSVWQNRVSFVQVCGRSRAGIESFDQYWQDCQGLAKVVNERWRTPEWQPIEWIETAIEPDKLSALYRNATAMLVNPVRDGLNLTAKEFVACQAENPGVLLLSPGAGAWHELGKYALPADPLATHQTSASIHQALNMSQSERKMRNHSLKRSIDANPMSSWWRTVTLSSQPTVALPVARPALEPLRKLERLRKLG